MSSGRRVRTSEVRSTLRVVPAEDSIGMALAPKVDRTTTTVVLRPSLSASTLPSRCHEHRHPREDLGAYLPPHPYVRSSSPRTSSHAGGALVRPIPPVVTVAIVLCGTGIEERTTIVQHAKVVRQVKQILAFPDPRVVGPQQREQESRENAAPAGSADACPSNADIRRRMPGAMPRSPSSHALPLPSSGRTGAGRRMQRARGQNDPDDIAR